MYGYTLTRDLHIWCETGDRMVIPVISTTVQARAVTECDLILYSIYTHFDASTTDSF